MQFGEISHLHSSTIHILALVIDANAIWTCALVDGRPFGLVTNSQH